MSDLKIIRVGISNESNLCDNLNNNKSSPINTGTINLQNTNEFSDDDSVYSSTPIVNYLDNFMSSRSYSSKLKEIQHVSHSASYIDTESIFSNSSSTSTTPILSPPIKLTSTNNGDNNRGCSSNEDENNCDGEDDFVNNIEEREELIRSSSSYHDSDYDSKSDVSTLSSSPINDNNTFIKIDQALLEEKFARLGFNRFTNSVPSIKLYNENKNNINKNNKNNNNANDNNNNSNNNNTSITVTAANNINTTIIPNTSNEGDNDTDENDEYKEDSNTRAPLIRSTSLKTGKTPPNTPGRKKVVRFADSLGIEIEYVKLISQDEIPKVPKSAFLDLKIPLLSSENNDNNMCIKSYNNDHNSKSNGHQSNNNFVPWVGHFNSSKTMMIEFMQPFQSINFYNRVRSQKVSLESCEVSSGAGNISVTCYIRVMNVSFEKQVTVRHTVSEWQFWTDSLASYLPNSCDGWSDKFVVTFYIRPNAFQNGYMLPGQRVFFAIRYTVNGEEFWDNNLGLNYSLIYR